MDITKSDTLSNLAAFTHLFFGFCSVKDSLGECGGGGVIFPDTCQASQELASTIHFINTALSRLLWVLLKNEDKKAWPCVEMVGLYLW